MEYIIFTDLDGTLVDHDTYSYEAALDAIKLLDQKDIPLIFCTSKTRAEIEVYVKKLNISHPFISENGGAIFIPRGYFNVDFEYTSENEDYEIIELGTRYEELRRVLSIIRDRTSLPIIGFGDLNAEEVSKDTGLDIESATLAKNREYDEAFKMEDDSGTELLKEHILAQGLNFTKGGRYWHLMGDNDKGMAVSILSELYRKIHPSVVSVGLGDSQNDLPMLQTVDVAFLVQKPDGKHDPSIDDDDIIRVEGIGPEGWNRAILKLIGSNKNRDTVLS